MTSCKSLSKLVQDRVPAIERPMSCSPMLATELVGSIRPHPKMIDTRIYASCLRNESIISSKNFFATH